MTQPHDWSAPKKSAVEIINDFSNFILEQANKPSQPDKWLLGWDGEKGVLRPRSRQEIEILFGTQTVLDIELALREGVPINIRGHQIDKLESVRA